MLVQGQAGSGRSWAEGEDMPVRALAKGVKRSETHVTEPPRVEPSGQRWPSSVLEAMVVDCALGQARRMQQYGTVDCLSILPNACCQGSWGLCVSVRMRVLLRAPVPCRARPRDIVRVRASQRAARARAPLYAPLYTTRIAVRTRSASARDGALTQGRPPQ